MFNKSFALLVLAFLMLDDVYAKARFSSHSSYHSYRPTYTYHPKTTVHVHYGSSHYSYHGFHYTKHYKIKHGGNVLGLICCIFCCIIPAIIIKNCCCTDRTDGHTDDHYQNVSTTITTNQPGYGAQPGYGQPQPGYGQPQPGFQQ